MEDISKQNENGLDQFYTNIDINLLKNRFIKLDYYMSKDSLGQQELI